MNLDEDGNEWYEYRIVTGTALATLEEAVNEKIREGFHPIGGPVYYPGAGFYQAMWNGHTPVDTA